MRVLLPALALAFIVHGHAGPDPQSAAGVPWILVDTDDLVLFLMQGDTTIATYENIAIGSRGATWSKRLGDEKTPKGNFRILEIRTSERFVLFLTLDYPTLEYAERAHREGSLPEAQLHRIRAALAADRPPPQDTALGGHIGIHGIGAGSPDIHRNVNWTDGCIALTNDQVEDLARRIVPGIVVKIR